METNLMIGIVAGIVIIILIIIIIVIYNFFFKKKDEEEEELKEEKKEINKEIRDARERLRIIYSKYTNELRDVVLKIDNMLEVLENK